MRGLVKDLDSPYPMGDSLPAMFQESEFSMRFVSAFDASLAPLISSLDNFAAYVDPWLAPEDFLEWLASWVGIALDDSWPIERRRSLVARAAQLYARRGTVAGLAEQVAVYTGSVPEIFEGGGVAWTAGPHGKLPGTGATKIIVRVRTTNAAALDLARLDAVVAAAKPAHLEHEIEVVVE